MRRDRDRDRDRDGDRKEVMKKFTIKGVLDNFRASVAQTARPDQEIQENLKTEHFQVKRTFRHGFPFNPTAMAYDPIQKLLAIGSKGGSLRILGQPGVDVHVRHDMDGPPSSAAVLHLQFIINEGALISATADDSIHLWNFKQEKLPQLVQSLKFQKEKITYMHLPLQSKWLYVGTERGNVHIVHVENFTLSGYVINWNKAMEVTRKTHPGAVVHLSDNPLDANKLLIGFESGQIALWDLRNKSADIRFQTVEQLRSICWHHDGKQFMCSHTDGSLTTWTTRQNSKPVHVSQPHAKVNKDGKLEQCKPITKIEWKSSKSGESYVIFSGGMPYDQAGRTPSITVVYNKTTTVLEMEHNVVDFITLCESPYTSELQEPFAIIALLQNDLVVMDLQTSGFPCLENPYPMDIHESPVTCCSYLVDCPADLIPAFYTVGKSGSTKKTGFSEREWVISGGTWSAQSCSYSEIIMTGHADGSIKFWDASAGTLQVLYKLKTAKIFEKPKVRSVDGDEDPFAIELLSLCPESRKLCVAGASSHVILFSYKKTETSEEVPVLEIPIVYEIPDDLECSPDCQLSASGSGGSTSRLDMLDFDNKREVSCFLKVRSGIQKKVPGFQAQLVCLTPHNNGEPPSKITALTLNSSYGLMAYGNEAGIVIVDIEQKVCLLNVGSPDLYGAQDPYSRALRSPKRNNPCVGDGLGIDRDERQPRSPSIDQMESTPFQCPCPTPTESSAAAFEATEEEQLQLQPLPAQATRRRQSVWKTFSKPFTKVDQKIKEKRNSIFYPDVSPSQDELSSDSQESVDENTVVEIQKSPPTQQKSYDETEEDEDVPVIVGSLGSQEEAIIKHKQTMMGRRMTRPMNLDLYDENGAPIRPPRRKKDLELSRRRDNRLLSVPIIKLQKNDLQKLKDLRDKNEREAVNPPTTTSFAGNLMRRLNKLDNSFSRSRSSSMSSLENITSEAIQCLAFADSYAKRSEPHSLTPTLWVGTSLGSVLTILITPPDQDSRSSQPVVVSLVGVTIFRLKGCILNMSFLDCNGSLIPYTYESWRDDFRERKSDRTPTKTANRMSPTLSGENQNKADSFGDRQFVVIASDKQARVVALPSQTCVYRQQIADADFVVKAEIVSLRDSVCLVCFVSNGHLMAYSLPSLRPLIDIHFLPLSELSFQTQTKKGIVDPMLSIWGQQLIINEDTDQIARTFCFSNRGQGLYLCSPSELQKFTLCADFCTNLSEMVGELYITAEMPEPPKEGFFKGLFGGGVRSLDREELFGEASGKANKAVAKHVPGTMQDLNSRVHSSTSEISRAHKLAMERGEKLNKLEESAERMRNEAENFASTAHSLMLKEKDKKWYQL